MRFLEKHDVQGADPQRGRFRSFLLAAFKHFLANERDLEDVVGPCNGSWDDCISSIRVPEGWQATIYEDPNYREGSLTVTSDVPDLDDVMGPCGNDWENCISSIRVFRQ